MWKSWKLCLSKKISFFLKKYLKLKLKKDKKIKGFSEFFFVFKGFLFKSKRLILLKLIIRLELKILKSELFFIKTLFFFNINLHLFKNIIFSIDFFVKIDK